MAQAPRPPKRQAFRRRIHRQVAAASVAAFLVTGTVITLSSGDQTGTSWSAGTAAGATTTTGTSATTSNVADTGSSTTTQQQTTTPLTTSTS